MPINPEVLSAIGGNGLTAGDYAGMTPEQIAMVAGQGQKDRQIMLGTVMDMSQQELAERKQAQEEMQQDRMFKMMQRQEARAEFQTMHSAMFDQMKYALDKKRLGLEAQQTQAALANSGLEREKLTLQLDELKRQKETLGKMQDKYLEMPGYTDEKGNPLKMSIGELYAMGALDKAIDAGLKKAYYDKASGGSKVVELREYMAKTAQEMGASELAVQRIKLMGPEAVKGMNKSTVLSLHMKNNPLFSTMSPEEKQKIIDKDLAMIDMLKVDLASTLADEGMVYGADTPGGKAPSPKTLEQIMMED